MAWLQNLAGRAEDLLNKIDQNAATVLNESNTKPETIIEQVEEVDETNSKGSNASIKSLTSVQSSPLKLLPEPTLVAPELSSSGVIFNVGEEDTLRCDRFSSTSSLQNSFEEPQVALEKLTALENENQELNKQLLNLQHMYSEVRNENSSLLSQLDRLNEEMIASQNEKEQYIARAQRILQEKEKMISLNQNTNKAEFEDNIYATFYEDIKSELHDLQNKNNELQKNGIKLLNELRQSQREHDHIQNELQKTIENMERNLKHEKNLRKIAEEESEMRLKELHQKNQQVRQFQEKLKGYNTELLELQMIVKNKCHIAGSEDLESRINSLTQTLMIKQNSLETVTTERNALKLQLEKLENEYKLKLLNLQRSQVKVINVQETTEIRSDVPQFMRVTPLDAGVTRRVKHAYSTVDAISVRTGIFLRRYPVARVFVFCYMALLHVWVLIILFLYAPNSR